MLKVNRNPNDYETYYHDAIQYLTRFNFDKIKADCQGWEKPAGLINANSEEVFVPDITGYRANSKSYFEIALKTKNEGRLAAKWKLLESIARLRNGIFTIFVPKGHYSFTQNLIHTYEIQAQLVKI